VVRRYGQLEIAHNGVPFKPEHMNYDGNVVMDPVYSFFIFCHSIKDWIKNDDLVDPQVKEKVEPFIEANACLKSCADIANGIKHLKLKRKRSRTLPKFIRSERNFITDKTMDITKIDSPEYKDVIVKDFFYLDTDQGTIEVFDLATECVEKWRKFIEDNICKL
jgi:hypothetical protein